MNPLVCNWLIKVDCSVDFLERVLLKFPFKRELEMRRGISWKPPTDTPFGSTSAFLRRLYSPQASASQWLNTMTIQEPKHPCTTWNSSNGHPCSWTPHPSGQDSQISTAAQRLFLPNPPFVFFSFHRGQSYTVIWSLSQSGRVPILLYPSEVFLLINLLCVQYHLMVCFSEDPNWYSLQLDPVGLN